MALRCPPDQWFYSLHALLFWYISNYHSSSTHFSDVYLLCYMFTSADLSSHQITFVQSAISYCRINTSSFSGHVIVKSSPTPSQIWFVRIWSSWQPICLCHLVKLVVPKSSSFRHFSGIQQNQVSFTAPQLNFVMTASSEFISKDSIFRQILAKWMLLQQLLFLIFNSIFQFLFAT